ncbi:hypothetical protein CPB83DRAFT_856885 [Crepidotus variabilis]|uniref:Uncharacterized protein n=1 Tax=Crepidotus variabilis TaxID=179855 RepID=A0A9P6EDI3_9AGAR|nr:hypothetical protein CPB83DRAFT_856885 [Crepidotus variabilis]
MANSELARKRGKNLSNANLRLSGYPLPQMDQSQTGVAFPAPAPDSAYTLLDSPLPAMTPVMSATHRARRASAAEKVLEQLRSRDIQKSGSVALSSPRASWLNFQQHEPVVSATTATTALVSPNTSTSLSTVSASVSSTITVMPSSTVQDSPTKGPLLGRSEGRRLSLTTPSVPPSSPVLSKMTLAPARTTRPSRSPSVGQIGQPLIAPAGVPPLQPTIPPDMIPLMDGDHHTDELSVRFEVGWPLLEQWLVTIGGGAGDGDYGRVAIIYR